MKVIILAADSYSFYGSQRKPLPKCLLPIKGITLLERQLRTLNYCGYSINDILVVIGSQGEWFGAEIIEKIKHIHPNVIINPINTESGSCYSLSLALKGIGLKDDILVIDSDLIFQQKMISLIKPGKNLILTRPLLGLNESGGFVAVKNNRVIDTSIKVMPKTFDFTNCYLHSGIVAFEKNSLPVLFDKLHENMKSDLLCAVAAVCSTIQIMNINYLNTDDSDERKSENGYELVGGSYATLKKKIIVRKEARGKGVKKLRNEILWLKNIDEAHKPYFPTILNFQDSPDLVWFEMPYYNLPNLRELIMVGEVGIDKTLLYLENILDFMFDNIYSKIIQKAPKDWIRKRCLNRINLRLLDTMRISPILDKFINAEYIILNGQKLRNLSGIVRDIAMRPKLIEALNPEYLRMVHGDLHFQNILIDINNDKGKFLLMDPRGEINGSDIYYDMGKLWHSFHGCYDFLHTDQFQLEWNEKDNNINVDLILENTGTLLVYDELNYRVPDLIQKYELICNDKLWKIKTLFSELTHFGSVMPFHVENDGKDQRSVSMYVTAVKLANEFVESLDKERWPRDNSYVNINTLEDYRNVLQNYKTGIEDTFDDIGDKI